MIVLHIIYAANADCVEDRRMTINTVPEALGEYLVVFQARVKAFMSAPYTSFEGSYLCTVEFISDGQGRKASGRVFSSISAISNYSFSGRNFAFQALGLLVNCQIVC